jgi:hypothetical protein
MSTQPLEAQIAALLREAAAAHSRAFASTDGYDPDWPRWYADYLLAPLDSLLGRTLDLGQVAAELAALDADQRQNAPGADWPLYYAAWFVQRYTSSAQL